MFLICLNEVLFCVQKHLRVLIRLETTYEGPVLPVMFKQSVLVSASPAVFM